MPGHTAPYATSRTRPDYPTAGIPSVASSSSTSLDGQIRRASRYIGSPPSLVSSSIQASTARSSTLENSPETLDACELMLDASPLEQSSSTCNLQTHAEIKGLEARLYSLYARMPCGAPCSSCTYPCGLNACHAGHDVNDSASRLVPSIDELEKPVAVANQLLDDDDDFIYRVFTQCLRVGELPNLLAVVARALEPCVEGIEVDVDLAAGGSHKPTECLLQGMEKPSAIAIVSAWLSDVPLDSRQFYALAEDEIAECEHENENRVTSAFGLPYSSQSDQISSECLDWIHSVTDDGLEDVSV